MDKKGRLCDFSYTMLKNLWRKFELTVGGLKFAVLIILLFAILLTIGTFVESTRGTDYANRLIYKSFPFMFTQFMMFLSIFFATVLRLPLKKRLYGFYVIHLGLMTLFIGSFVTYYSGIDGSISLSPNEPARDIMVNDDQLVIRLPDDEKEVSYALPYAAIERTIGRSYGQFEILRYLPFSEDEVQWLSDSNQNAAGMGSGQYQLQNDRFSERLILSLHPFSDFNSTMTLGLLNAHFMPASMANCFGEAEKSRLVIWRADNDSCMTPESLGVNVSKAKNGKRFLTIPHEDKKLTFYPDFSPLPVTDDMKVIEGSPYRIFSQQLFEDKPHLFLFGEKAAYFDKNAGKWTLVSMLENSDGIALPWMGFKLKLIKWDPLKYPVNIPKYKTPLQDNGQLIEGDMKAVELRIKDKNFWVRNDRPMSLTVDGKRATISIEKKSLKLPYEIVLSQFKMDKDPGTNNPASYESFVQIFKNEGATDHHVYMNHPLKLNQFTFYQASYFEIGEGLYGSVLSVNYDPGRWLKYLGSLLLVLGSIWHFVLRSKRSTHV